MSRVGRRTLAESVELSGGGVFTGGEASVSLIPVDKPRGISFAVGDAVIPLATEQLLDTPNRTTLSAKGATVEVVEHLLACLHIAGVTDLLIECPNGELPLLDGSALPIWKAIVSAGYKNLDGRLKPVTVSEPVYAEADDAVLIGLPASELKITYFLAYDDPRIGSEFASLTINEDTFGSEIAPARTFMESDRARKLVENGFIKTTDASQALLVYPDGVHGEFRVEKEFAKHKILDLIGDLYLTGRPARGHFIGLRSGHGLNHRIIRRLASAG